MTGICIHILIGLSTLLTAMLRVSTLHSNHVIMTEGLVDTLSDGLSN